MTTDRPNILYIFTDEHSAQAMSCSENPTAVRTPEMDKLAARGVRFSRAYCSQPLCTPSRATMLTGVMPHTHGATTNGPNLATYTPGVIEGRWPMLGRVFADAGYRTAWLGKWHVPCPIHLKDAHGFQSGRRTRRYPANWPPGWARTMGRSWPCSRS
jgi:choline-sulfatase